MSVIIVSFNTVEKLRRCLRAVETEHEVIVVDNASGDGSAEMVRSEFPHVRLLALPENIGFGPANNRGLEVASGDAVLFLNSDCYPDPGAIDLLYQTLERHPEAVAVGGKLLNSDRTLQESIAGPLSLRAVFLEQTYLDRIARRVGRGYWRTREALQRAQQGVAWVDQVMGACLMVRADRGQPPERFDERYFLYCEDTDLCLRLRKHGRIGYFPSAEFVHDLGSSSAKNPALGIIRYNRGKELFFEIHQGRGAAMICGLLNRLGAALRMMIWLAVSVVRPAKRTQVAVFWRVLTAPRRD